MNMSYCRFYNTYHDLVDCKDALCNRSIESEEEKKYAKRLLELCQEIADDYDYFIEEIDEMGKEDDEDED